MTNSIYFRKVLIVYWLMCICSVFGGKFRTEQKDFEMIRNKIRGWYNANNDCGAIRSANGTCGSDFLNDITYSVWHCDHPQVIYNDKMVTCASLTGSDYWDFIRDVVRGTIIGDIAVQYSNLHRNEIKAQVTKTFISDPGAFNNHLEYFIMQMNTGFFVNIVKIGMQ
eukprot:205571_1